MVVNKSYGTIEVKNNKNLSLYLNNFLDLENHEDYKTRKNAQHYAESIDNEAKSITRRLSSHGLALKEEKYAEVGLQQRLGEIPYYHSLGDISNILHVPVPFLEPESFFERNKNDELFCKVSKSKSDKMIKQRNRLRDMYAQLCTNITTLIELDGSIEDIEMC